MKILARVLLGAVVDTIIICDVLLIVDLISKSVGYHKTKKVGE